MAGLAGGSDSAVGCHLAASHRYHSIIDPSFQSYGVHRRVELRTRGKRHFTIRILFMTTTRQMLFASAEVRRNISPARISWFLLIFASSHTVGLILIYIYHNFWSLKVKSTKVCFIRERSGCAALRISDPLVRSMRWAESQSSSKIALEGAASGGEIPVLAD
jgi:hypothetical protein